MTRHGSVWIALPLCILIGGMVAGLLKFSDDIIPVGNHKVSMISPRLAADAPIRVFNDSAWADVPGKTGTGTMSDPYVIADKIIDAGGTDAGIWIENTTKSFIIRNCSVTRGVYPLGGIYIANASNSLIISNNCSLNSIGIQLGRLCSNITIKDNNATSSDWHGIVIFTNSNGNIVTGNNASGNTMTGIVISLNSNANTVVNNMVSGNGNRGISIVQGAAWNNLSRNNCSGNTWYAIELFSNSANNTLTENSMINNQHGGVHVQNSVNNTFIGNNASGNIGAGLFLEGSAENNTFANNMFTNNIDGMLLSASAKNNTFARNNATSNTNYGINLTTGAVGNWFYGNNFSGNGVGQGWDAGSFNRWDDGATGNIWGDYAGVDPDDDLIGETPYAVDGPAGAKDNYPYCDDGNDVAPVILSTSLPTFCGIAAPSFALDIKEPYGMSDIWVTYNGGMINYSCSAAGVLPQWSTLGNGTYTITFWANDTDNFVGTIAVLLHKDILAPALAVPNPAAGASFTEAPLFTITVTDAQLDLTWYTIGSDATKHYFTGTTFTVDASAWAALPAGEVTIRVYASDTLGNLRTVPVTITKAVSSDLGWLWFVAIGGVIAVVLVVVVLRKKRRIN